VGVDRRSLLVRSGLWGPRRATSRPARLSGGVTVPGTRRPRGGRRGTCCCPGRRPGQQRRRSSGGVT